MKQVINLIIIIFVFLLIGIGCVGLFVPVLPTTPFFLLAVTIIAKVDKKLHSWFVSTELYKSNLESFVQSRAMTKKAKVKLLSTVTVMLAIGFYFSPNIARIVIVMVGIFHYFYFIFGVQTVE